MADEPNVAAPVETPKPPMTEQAFVEELQSLIKRGEAANLSPLTIITRVVFRRGVGMLDGFLASVESSIGVGGKKG